MSDFDKENKTLSILGFVAAILAIVVDLLGCFIPGMGVALSIAALVLAVVAIVVSAIALKKKQGIKALAIIGLVLGIIFLALTLILLIAVVFFVGGAIYGGVNTASLFALFGAA